MGTIAIRMALYTSGRLTRVQVMQAIRSYRDTLLLWLRFLARDSDARIAALTLADLTPEAAVRFLGHLEKTRGNSVATRNVRLTEVADRGAAQPARPT
jgi:hypothetical protein